MSISSPLLTEELLYNLLVSEAFTAADPDAARVGLETEFLPLNAHGFGTLLAQPAREVGTDMFGGPAIGLYPWLMLLAERHNWMSAPTESSAAIAFEYDEGGLVTLEPGGQIEYSSPPEMSAEVALEKTERFATILREEGERIGLVFLDEGCNRHTGRELPHLVVRKPRYLAMDKYFERLGPYGRMMMRSTCATQVNLDFGPPEVASRRWKLINLAAPALNALFANSPGEIEGTSFPSVRYEIWRRTDPSRTGIPDGMLGKDPAAAYLRFAVKAEVLLLHDPVDGFRAPKAPMTFRDWLKGESSELPPDLEDWRLHLTTLFPDVRPRGFIELRSIDALPARERRAAVILSTLLLYDATLLDTALALFDDDDLCRKSGADESFDDRFTVGAALLRTAIETTGDAELRAYAEEYTEKGLTPGSKTDYELLRVRG